MASTRGLVLARPDGTDLRTGTVSLVEKQAVAAIRAPVRLIESPVHLIAVGGMEDRAGAHRPWRVFEVESELVDTDYDVDDSMALGFGQLRASRMRVHAERTLDESLGFPVDERAGEVLARIERLRQTPWFLHPDRSLDGSLGDADLAALTALAALAHRTEAGAAPALIRDDSLEAAGARIDRIVDRGDRHWGEQNREIFEHLAGELAKVCEDAANLACASARVARVVDELAELADEIDRDTPEALARLPLQPSQLVTGHLRWQLVDPILAAPPTPLVDPFAGLAALVLRGYVPLGWYDGALAIYAASP